MLPHLVNVIGDNVDAGVTPTKSDVMTCVGSAKTATEDRSAIQKCVMKGGEPLMHLRQMQNSGLRPDP